MRPELASSDANSSLVKTKLHIGFDFCFASTNLRP